MFLSERLTHAVFLLAGVVLLATVLMVVLAVGRRLQRERYFRRLDGIRNVATPLLRAMLDQALSYEDGLRSLNQAFGRDQLSALGTVLLEDEPPPDHVPMLRRLCEDLGLVKIWQDQLQAKRTFPAPDFIERFKPFRFLGRARAARDLGLIMHRPSWPLLACALDDPNPEVQWAATRSLGAIREPASFPSLTERLRRQARGALSDSGGSPARATRSAMIDFPLRCAADLILLLNHATSAVRREAAEVVREMVEREADRCSALTCFSLSSEDFSPDLTDVFLTKLAFDADPDVRARAASVLRYLPGWRSESVLAKLLGDEVWFVRLRAARALAHPRFQFLAGRVARLLTDGHWRVREAATQTLIAQGDEGVRELVLHFFGEAGLDERRGNGEAGTSRSPDLYSREQIAEQMQRSGLLYVLADHYDEWASRDGSTAISQLARAGLGAYLLDVLNEARRRAAQTVSPETEPAQMVSGG